MAIVRSLRPIAAARLEALARSLLDASDLCAIATSLPGGRAHVNTAYFAYSSAFEIVWLSDPGARHSRNLRGGSTAAIAVYDSTQEWGGADRGIQLFGAAREISGGSADEAQRIYAARFARYEAAAVADYSFFRFRPRRLKLFDERELGAGVFVAARLDAGALRWETTEISVPRSERPRRNRP